MKPNSKTHILSIEVWLYGFTRVQEIGISAMNLFRFATAMHATTVRVNNLP